MKTSDNSSGKERRNRKRDSVYNKKMEEATCSTQECTRISGWITKLELWADELLERTNEW